jgi:hypothetical protein
MRLRLAGAGGRPLLAATMVRGPNAVAPVLPVAARSVATSGNAAIQGSESRRGTATWTAHGGEWLTGC